MYVCYKNILFQKLFQQIVSAFEVFILGIIVS